LPSERRSGVVRLALDRIGRKPIIMAGCALAALTYFPLFHALTAAANPALSDASARAPILVTADPNDCSFQFDRSARPCSTAPATIAKSYLARAGLPYANASAAPGTVATVRVGGATVASFDGRGLAKGAFAEKKAAFEEGLGFVTLAAAIRRKPTAPWCTSRGGADPLGPHDLCRHGVRSDRRHAGRDVPAADPLHLDELPITSAMAGSAASCRPRRSPWWRQAATSISVSGIPSRSQPSRWSWGFCSCAKGPMPDAAPSIRDADLVRDRAAMLAFIMGLQHFEHAFEKNRRLDEKVAGDYLAILLEDVAANGGKIFMAESAGQPIGWRWSMRMTTTSMLSRPNGASPMSPNCS
jgi:hypothetical protein